jgi:hypothetical protein
VKTALATVQLQDAVQRAADVAAMLVETPAAIVVVVLASPVKDLLELTTGVVLRLSAPRKLDEVVLSAVVEVALVAIKAIPATVAVMISNPVTFAMTLVATSPVLAQTTKASATAPVANQIHCAPAWTAWPVAAVVVVAIMAAVALAATVVAIAPVAEVLHRAGQVAIHQGLLDVKNR